MREFYILLLMILSTTVNAQLKNNLLTPPLGWNSWANYGGRVTEKAILANAETLARGIDQSFTSWKRWSVVNDCKFWIDMDMIPFGHLCLSNPDPN